VNAGSADVPSALSAQREHCGINSQRCADIKKALMMAMGEPVLRRHEDETSALQQSEPLAY